MTEPNKYQLKTFEDVFNKVPADKIMTCMVELAYSMAQAKYLENEAKEHGEDLGLVWPEIVEWIDDGKGECGYSITDTSGGYMEVINGEVRDLSVTKQ